MPVAAVSQGGRPSVSSGSQMARFGIRFGLMMPSLRPSERFMTEPRPTSLPVPDVVGIATSGATFGVIRATPPSTIAYCDSGSGWVASSPTALARSIADPPPSAISPSQSSSR